MSANVFKPLLVISSLRKMMSPDFIWMAWIDLIMRLLLILRDRMHPGTYFRLPHHQLPKHSISLILLVAVRISVWKQSSLTALACGWLHRFSHLSSPSPPLQLEITQINDYIDRLNWKTNNNTFAKILTKHTHIKWYRSFYLSNHIQMKNYIKIQMQMFGVILYNIIDCHRSPMVGSIIL